MISHDAISSPTSAPCMSPSNDTHVDLIHGSLPPHSAKDPNWAAQRVSVLGICFRRDFDSSLALSTLSLTRHHLPLPTYPVFPSPLRPQTRKESRTMSLALSGSAVKPTFFASLAPRLASIPQLIRPSWSIPCEPSSSSSPSSSTPAGLHQAQPQSTVTSLFPSLSGLLELFPPMLLHTPKKKVSRARRGKALQAQWLKNRTSEWCPPPPPDA